MKPKYTKGDVVYRNVVTYSSRGPNPVVELRRCVINCVHHTGKKGMPYYRLEGGEGLVPENYLTPEAEILLQQALKGLVE